ncbi:hypothetical protein BAQ53_24455 [Bacillus sp. B25(2016b)]|uniref:hypothetical protein n=1 Tax=Bacillus sp. B25(2016b) TaxID=1868655 RepID=UPI000803FAE2|nr:hypothetical protein [Bacillus sp. B25(2016b)]ANP83881.1 hypothetical protein BAQ53_24455 [Bacillus sp. B25(2016b)]
MEFVINAVNQLEAVEQELLFERYFWEVSYKSDTAHGNALGLPKHRYKRKINICREKMIELLGIEGIKLNIPEGAKEW